MAHKIETMRKEHNVALKDKDNIIKTLKENVLSATQNDNESKKKLEEEIKNISAKSDEISNMYNELKGKYEKELTSKKQKSSSSDEPKSDNEQKIPFKGMKLIHLDLKGAPPKVDYLLNVMQMCKQYGATGFLVEYEDMFPWSGELKIMARFRVCS